MFCYIFRRSRAVPTSNRVIKPKPPHPCTSKTTCVAIAAVALVCWLCTLSWLAFVLHAELARLDGNVQRGECEQQQIAYRHDCSISALKRGIHLCRTVVSLQGRGSFIFLIYFLNQHYIITCITNFEDLLNFVLIFS